MADDTTHEDRVKALIKDLFRHVEPEHRERVLDSLKQLRTNDERASFLRGWTKITPRS